MVSTKCPICDNPGIPDYHLQNVICPHCGSDLSIYKKINDAARLDNPKTSDHYFNAKKILIATSALQLLHHSSHTMYQENLYLSKLKR